MFITGTSIYFTYALYSNTHKQRSIHQIVKATRNLFSIDMHGLHLFPENKNQVNDQTE